MPLVVVLPLVTGISVVPPSQIVSSVAVMVTVGSTHTSTVIGVPGHLLLPFSSIVQGVMVYVTIWASALVLSRVCWIDVPMAWPGSTLFDSPMMSGLSVTVHV